MKSSLYTKIFNYLLLVCGNKYFMIGIICGYISKSLLGGAAISIVTGLAIGMIIHESFKYLVEKML